MLEAVIEIEYDMIRRMKGKYASVIYQKGIVLDIYASAIHKDYMNQRLVHQMVMTNEILGL